MSKIELEDVKKVLPNMNFLVLAVEDVDLSGVPEEDMEKRTQVFSASTFKTKSDFIQAELYKNSLTISKRNDKILYYDCTNYFF